MVWDNKLGSTWQEYHNKSQSGQLTCVLGFKPKTYQIENMIASYLIAGSKVQKRVL
jgi:hypothetical protein